MKIKIPDTRESKPITTVKPEHLTQEQWEWLTSDKEHTSEKTERAKQVVAKILEKNPNRFSR
jgi:hypothetical protein